jgi:LL-diaminopimelate aminotransferase
MKTIRLSQRLHRLPKYLAAEIADRLEKKRVEGADVISFGIGDPDISTPDHILDSLVSGSKIPEWHRYPPLSGSRELRQAIGNWYEQQFAVSLDPDSEVLPLIGSKEGIANLALCFVDPGSIALVPSPAYPVYCNTTLLAGGDAHIMVLTERNAWLPDFDEIPEHVLRRASILWLNYPNNPTGATADERFFHKAIEFASKHRIAICHDAAYASMGFDGYKPLSFLQIPGAREVGIELNSFSKTFNMAGWRVGMAVGNKSIISALREVKSNVDAGIPLPIQHMAVAALRGRQDVVNSNAAVYQRRRDKLVPVLQKMGLRVNSPRAGLYVWAGVPDGWKGNSLASFLLDEKEIFVTPGSGYGPGGDSYVRLSLTLSDARLDEAVARLQGWTIPAGPGC